MDATLDELLALDLLTLAAHTGQAGDPLDPAEHAQRLLASLATSTTCTVRREGRLADYAMLARHEGAAWFVSGFCVHPAHRQAAVLRELLRRVAWVVRREGIAELRSHVYQTNAASIAFHRRLGFGVARENAKAFEFVARVDRLTGRALRAA